MSKFNNTNTFAAAAFGAAAFFSMLSFGSSAEAALSVTSCKGTSASGVIACCEKLTEAKRPLWMIQTRTSCRQAVVCGGRSSGRECHVRRFIRINDGGDGNDGGDRGDGGNEGGDRGDTSNNPR